MFRLTETVRSPNGLKMALEVNVVGGSAPPMIYHGGATPPVVAK